MPEHHTLADRLRARASQLGLAPAHVAELAGVNRSFVYDILRGRSARPGLDRLAGIARVLKVDRDWLIHGIGEVEGASPFVENPDDTFVAIAHATPRPSMGGGAVVTDDSDTPGRAYHFRRSWIRHNLKSTPSQLRIMHVQGDSMAPTLLSGDTVLVDMTRRAPNPPGIFVLDDGMGLVAKRLEHIPNSDPPGVRIISDNPHYSPYERTSEEVNIIGRVRWYGREI
ncbi:LexA family transcriptional regulator [Paracoccus sp. 08]|uniref:XRE family transcriptional regulator n=1 Tax=Paracoccus sp. 08 TaxID=2606624 RepID=UPI00209423B3|nr:LexA family transcriptional regulator [Paracoccus sp. 08]MCO6361592.1 helix-turn-helix domain-containing protein [Paracoccus sp. 08]